MNAAQQITETINFLQQHKTNLCCAEVKKQLTQLGFVVRDGKQGGHKIFAHFVLPSFKSSSCNCSHGKNPEIKPAYISHIIVNIQTPLLFSYQNNGDIDLPGF